MGNKDAEIQARDYDVFDVWDVDDKVIRLPLKDDYGTVVPNVIASSFGNDLLPLISELPSKGVDVWDRTEVTEHLEGIGEEMWAGYLSDLSDGEWRNFLNFVELDIPDKQASLTKSGIYEVAEIFSYIDEAAIEGIDIGSKLGEQEVSSIMEQIQELAERGKTLIG